MKTGENHKMKLYLSSYCKFPPPQPPPLPQTVPPICVIASATRANIYTVEPLYSGHSI